MKTISVKNHPFLRLAAYVFYPTGLVSIWKNGNRLWLKLLYTVLGLLVFLLLSTYVGLVAFASFLPALDLSMGDRTDRTLFSKSGNYSVTFLETGSETRGAYELIKVELEPYGGNDWHYHKTFDEHFEVLEGEVTIGLLDTEVPLKEGEKITALREQIHFFRNNTAEKATLLVKVEPARAFEKTIRIGYGIDNDGLSNAEGIPDNFWHLTLLLGYSESYFAGLPAIIQEPLVKSLAKIAQWKGEDKALEKYFR